MRPSGLWSRICQSPEEKPSARRTRHREIWSCRREDHVPQQTGPWFPSGEPADLSGEAEFDSVDDAALARAVGPGNHEIALLEVNVELPNTSHFFDMGSLELDHLKSPPAGSENIFTKSRPSASFCRRGRLGAGRFSRRPRPWTRRAWQETFRLSVAEWSP